MKIHTIGMTALLALVFSGCQKSEVARTDEASSETTTPLPVSTPPPASTPPPGAPAIVSAPASTPPPATPPPRRAPEGVFYLLSAARIETDAGVVGLPVGTGVKRVRPGVYLTGAGEISLSDDQVTNDVDRATAARDAALAAQSAIKQRTAQETSQARAAKATSSVEAAAAHETAVKELERKRLEERLGALLRQEQELEGQERALRTQQSGERYREVFKGRTVTSNTDQRLSATSAQLATVRGQIAEARLLLQPR